MSKMNRPRLGRGLSSLLSVSEVDETSAATSTGAAKSSEGFGVPDIAVGGLLGSSVIELPVDEVVANPHQPRRQFNDASIHELAESLKANGLIQPIIVRRTGNQYELIAGERRLRAQARHAGLQTVPAIVKEVDGYSQAQFALVENIQREDLNPMDRAAAYSALIQQLGLTQAELAGRLGQDRSSIAHYLRLLDLPAELQEMVRDGRLTLGHAKLLAGVPEVAEKRRLAQAVVSQGLSVRNLERMLAEVPSPAAPASAPAASPTSAYLADLEKNFSRQLGMRVQIRAGAGKKKGKLIIHYGSLDQFDDLKDRLGVIVD